jgi:hypothetical protein
MTFNTRATLLFGLLVWAAPAARAQEYTAPYFTHPNTGSVT